MEEIRLSFTVIDECIQELKSLQSECVQTKYPEEPGSGMAAEGIWQLMQDYENFSISIEGLIDETIRYLAQIVRDFKETDEGMARELKKGVKS